MTRFQVTLGTVDENGGCMLCTVHHPDARGHIPRTATVNLLRAGRAEIRACDACLSKIGAACVRLADGERATVERLREARGDAHPDVVMRLLAIIDRLAPKE